MLVISDTGTVYGKRRKLPKSTKITFVRLPSIRQASSSVIKTRVLLEMNLSQFESISNGVNTEKLLCAS